jgi:hypothetical protein
MLTFHDLQVDVVLQVGGDVGHLCVQAQGCAQQVIKLPHTRISLEARQRPLDLNLVG